MGETNGALSGSLTSLLPPRGRLDIVAELFDIDDFVIVMDNFIAVKDQMKLETTVAEPPIQNTQHTHGYRSSHAAEAQAAQSLELGPGQRNLPVDL